LGFSELLNCGANVAETVARFDFGDRELERTPGDLGVVLGGFARLPNVEGCRSVAVVALVDVRHVDGDDVSVLKPAGARDPVADHLVHGRADALGKSAVVQRRWSRAEPERVLMDEIVDILGGDTRLDHRADSAESVGGERADLAHELNLTLRLDLDGTARETHDGSRFGPMVVVVTPTKLAERRDARPGCWVPRENARALRRPGYSADRTGLHLCR